MCVRIDYASHKKPPLILYCFRNLESCKISRRPTQGFQPILLSCLSASNTKLKSGNHRLNGRGPFHSCESWVVQRYIMKQGRYGNYERIANLYLLPFGQIDVAIFMIRLVFNLSALPARSI